MSSPDWSTITSRVEGRLRQRYGADDASAQDLAQDAVERVLTRLKQGETLRDPKAVTQTEAQHGYYRWRAGVKARGEVQFREESARDEHPSTVDDLLSSIGHEDRLSNSDDGSAGAFQTHVVLPRDRRGPGQERAERCADCRLWSWRAGRWVRRKHYTPPQFPRWIWQGGAGRIESTCPACPPTTLPRGKATKHKGAPGRVLYPSGEHWLKGEKAQALYAALWKLGRKVYGPRWTLTPGETFANGLGVLPAKQPSPWNPRRPDLYPTVPRSYARPKGRRPTMPDRVPESAALDRFTRPAIRITDADLAHEAQALQHARRHRHAPPIVTDGLVPAGTPLVCEACRAVNPFTLSCAHTFTKPSASDVKQARSAPITAGDQ